MKKQINDMEAQNIWKQITIPFSEISFTSADNEVEKMKNASPLALNLGPGVTPLG